VTWGSDILTDFSTFGARRDLLATFQKSHSSVRAPRMIEETFVPNFVQIIGRQTAEKNSPIKDKIKTKPNIT